MLNLLFGDDARSSKSESDSAYRDDFECGCSWIDWKPTFALSALSPSVLMDVVGALLARMLPYLSRWHCLVDCRAARMSLESSVVMRGCIRRSSARGLCLGHGSWHMQASTRGSWLNLRPAFRFRRCRPPCGMDVVEAIFWAAQSLFFRFSASADRMRCCAFFGSALRVRDVSVRVRGFWLFRTSSRLYLFAVWERVDVQPRSSPALCVPCRRRLSRWRRSCVLSDQYLFVTVGDAWSLVRTIGLTTCHGFQCVVI